MVPKTVITVLSPVILGSPVLRHHTWCPAWYLPKHLTTVGDTCYHIPLQQFVNSVDLDYPGNLSWFVIKKENCEGFVDPGAGYKNREAS